MTEGKESNQYSKPLSGAGWGVGGRFDSLALPPFASNYANTSVLL